MRAALPLGWFPQPNSDGSTNSPVLDGILNGIASIWAALFALYSCVYVQGRIATATDINLDLISGDYFGTALMRRPAEPDAAFLVRIQQELLRTKATRPSLIQRLTQLTGRTPIVFEPRNTADTGSYGTLSETASNGCFYGGPGGYGLMALGFQGFVTVYRPNGSGGVATGAVSDAVIFATVADTEPEGTIMWTKTLS